MPEKVFINTARAAHYLGLSPRTLEKLRVTGGGPIFVKMGRRVSYCIQDLDAWVDAHRRNSTSDQGSEAA